MIEVVSKHWIRSQARGKFFSPEAVKFFRSRMPDTGLRNGDSVWFWTSEQCGWAGDQERRFTLRRLDLIDGSISTVGEFQQYPTYHQAWVAVHEAARNMMEVEK